MGRLQSKSFIAKSGDHILVRSALPTDADQILELARSVIDEEIYQLTSSAEFKMTAADEEKWILSHQENPNHLLLVAVLNDRIVGMLDFSNGRRQRIAHTGEFGMSVAKDCRENGIGSCLIGTLIEWARSTKAIEKINLSVHSNNERAIALYKKMGFEVEGVRKRDLKYSNGNYIDTVIMGRTL